MRLTLPSRLRHRVPLHARIVCAVLAVCLLLLVLDGWRTWQAWDTAVAADEVETANLARSLAQHAHDTVRLADVIIAGLRERVETDGLAPDRPDRAARLDRVIATWLADATAISGLAVFDADGHELAGETAPPTSPGVEGHAYFQWHRDHADRAVHVGEPIRSRVDGEWSMTVSRRIDGRDGRFAGIVRARISVPFLQSFYRGFDIGRQDVIALVSTEGVIVAHTEAAGKHIGGDVSGGPVFRRISSGQLAGSFRFVSPLDGIERLGSFRRVDSYPLFVVVGHALDAVMGGWRRNAWLHVVVSLCVAALLTVAGSRFAGQVRIGQRAEQRYRLLADNSSDAIVCLALDRTRRYVSPAFTVLTGWALEDEATRRWFEIIHPEDRPLLAGVVPQLLAGAAQVTSCFRYICSDGSLLWVEARERLLQGVDGETQVISNVRDISDRRAAEDQVDLLNRELARQANTDGLTGLANRRRFDEVLAREWRRALREELPLSLLMIDVDRFKLYNDRYGHQQGDACLRAVAAALAQVARRPADMAARYGGEEFVILLPGLDAAGSAASADRVLDAIASLGIEHEDNRPAGVITASVGVASVMPHSGRPACSDTALVAGADAALYEAKRSGRNRAVTQPEAVPADMLDGVRDAAAPA